MKQSKGFNGDLELEYKKTTNRITINPTTDIDSQASTRLVLMYFSYLKTFMTFLRRIVGKYMISQNNSEKIID